MSIVNLLSCVIDKKKFESINDYIAFCSEFLKFSETGFQKKIISKNESHYQFFQYKKDGNFNKIHVVGTASFSQIVRGFDIIKSKEVWNAVKLVRLKREGTVLSFAIEITAFQSRGTYEEEKYRTDRSDGDR